MLVHHTKMQKSLYVSNVEVNQFDFVKFMPSSLLQSDDGVFTHMITVRAFTIGSREL